MKPVPQIWKLFFAPALLLVLGFLLFLGLPANAADGGEIDAEPPQEQVVTLTLEIGEHALVPHISHYKTTAAHAAVSGFFAYRFSGLAHTLNLSVQDPPLLKAIRFYSVSPQAP